MRQSTRADCEHKISFDSFCCAAAFGFHRNQHENGIDGDDDDDDGGADIALNNIHEIN